MQSLVTGERVVLIEGGRDARYVETGHLVYALNGVLFAVAFDRDARQVLGGPVPLVEGVRDTGVTGAAHFSVARNGSLVYVRGLAGGGTVVSLVWVGRDGDEERLPAPPRAYDRPRVSPDGTRVAVDIADGDNTDVWIWDLARETLTQLTFDEGVDDFPLWTPDSARIVFQLQPRRRRAVLEGGRRHGPGRAAQGRRGAPLRLGGGRAVDLRASGLTSACSRWRASAPWRCYSTQNSGKLSRRCRRMAGGWSTVSSETGPPLIYVQPFPNIDDGLWNVSLDFGAEPRVVVGRTGALLSRPNNRPDGRTGRD